MTVAPVSLDAPQFSGGCGYPSVAGRTRNYEASSDEPCPARMRLYERAKSRDPRNHFLLLDLAREYGLHQRMIEAQETLRQILRLYPESARVRIMVAEAYFRIGLLHQAREQYQQVLRIDPERSDAARMLAELSSQ